MGAYAQNNDGIKERRSGRDRRRCESKILIDFDRRKYNDRRKDAGEDDYAFEVD